MTFSNKLDHCERPANGPILIWSVFTLHVQLELNCPTLIYHVLTWLYLSQLDLSWPDLSWTCPDLTSAELNSPELTRPDLPFKHYVGTIKISIYNLQIPSRHPLDIIQTPSVHHPDTLPTPSKDTSDNIQTPFWHPPNFTHSETPTWLGLKREICKSSLLQLG